MSTLIHHDGVFKEVDVIHIMHDGLWKEVSGKQFIPGMPMEGGFFGGLFTYGDGLVYALILADKAAEQALRWKTARTTTSGTSSNTDGWANTNAMNNSSHPAAQHCRQYDGGGFNDWYLGAPEEYQTIAETLNRGKTVLEVIAPDFATGGAQVLPTYMWTSRSGSSGFAHRITTLSGAITSNGYKDTSYPVRPIRRVPVSI